jgi:cytochrome c556
MKKLSTLLGALLAPMLLISCSQGGGSAAVDDSPEGVAFRYRHGLMEAVAWKTARLRGMADGSIPVNEAEFVKSARDLATLGGMLPEGFIPNSIVEGSRALPDIWMNFNDFTQKAGDLSTRAQALADAAAANGFEASKGMVQAVGQTCGACHRPYRGAEDEGEE